jgi:hypothetical protein
MNALKKNTKTPMRKDIIVCDGCGLQIEVVKPPGQLDARLPENWFTAYTPDGVVEVCSKKCFAEVAKKQCLTSPTPLRSR